jgi:hypothetical protein
MPRSAATVRRRGGQPPLSREPSDFYTIRFGSRLCENPY